MEYCCVMYGTNDWWHGRNVQITATEYFDKLTKVYPQVKTYALLPIYRLDAAEKHPEVKIPFMKFRDDLRDIMSKYRQITVIDTIDFIPPFAEFYEDGYLHPNDIGFMRYAENLKNYLMF